MCQLIDKFWDNEGDQFGRAVGDMNVYTTGLLGKFNVVLILLPNMGKVSATGAAASLRSSYPHLKLALVMGTCGGVPHPESGQELLLGDVVISKTVVQYDLGRQYSDVFEARDTVEDTLGRPHKSVRTLLALLETDRTLELLETRTGKFLKEIQNKAANRPSARERPRYQYPGAAQDKLFPPNYQHKHHLSAECVCKNHSQSGDPICEASRKQACDVVGCDTGRLIDRERVRLKRQQETEGDFDTAQAPSIFFGPVASGDRVVKSSIDRDIIAGRHGILAFDMEAAGVWDELPCIMVKGICNYADSHRNKDWQEFAAATAASATKALLERYIKTDRSPRPI
ncbi:nucleoside phosphorylase domain-containing protein [Cladorrhinum sp. PSN332]|nr:nucleoside phosphorylase domain-containing protein [Cladorrhinum sp. PSN332]